MAIITQMTRGRNYARYVRSGWDKKAKKRTKTEIHLGRVVDLEKRIFRDREGLFRFDEKSLAKEHVEEPSAPAAGTKVFPVATLDFGDAWLMSEVLSKSGIGRLADAAADAAGVDRDAASSLVSYYVLERSPNSQFPA